MFFNIFLLANFSVDLIGYGQNIKKKPWGYDTCGLRAIY